MEGADGRSCCQIMTRASIYTLEQWQVNASKSAYQAKAMAGLKGISPRQLERRMRQIFQRCPHDCLHEQRFLILKAAVQLKGGFQSKTLPPNWVSNGPPAYPASSSAHAGARRAPIWLGTATGEGSRQKTLADKPPGCLKTSNIRNYGGNIVSNRKLGASGARR
jgi:hypothetical protein